MELSDVLTIVAIASSPLIAILVSLWLSRWLQNMKERRDHQMYIFNMLFSHRHTPAASENLTALNSIDLAFRDKKRVRDLWRKYFDMLGNENLNNKAGWELRVKKYYKLLSEMAKVLGYGKEINKFDVERVYTPVGIMKQFETNKELQDELLRVLKNTARFETVPKKSPTERDPQAG